MGSQDGWEPEGEDGGGVAAAESRLVEEEEEAVERGRALRVR